MHVYELPLEDGLPKTIPGRVNVLPVLQDPYILRLKFPSTSSVVHEGTVFTNYPKQGAEFDRTNFVAHKLDQAKGLQADHHVDLEIRISGTFTVYTEYTAQSGAYAQSSTSQEKTPQWDFVVPPSFTLASKSVTPNEMCVQTVLSKLMGPFSDWKPKLKAIADKGYNVIHFVPLQARGESDSPFSIADQLGWDEAVFPNGEKDILDLVTHLEKDLGILPLSDLVLNHTANNSPWLADHPDAGYSSETAPYLDAAIALDDALLDLSEKLGSEGKTIASQQDLDAVMNSVPQAIDDIKLWEYYVVDVAALEKNVTEHPFQGRPAKNLPTTLTALAQQLADEAGQDFKRLGPRFSRRVDTTKLAEYVASSAFSARQILDEVNVPLYAQYNDDRKSILTQVRDRQRYLRLDGNGPHIGTEISRKTPIIESYFTRVKTDKGVVALANSGWVWAGNPLVDFAGPDSRVYVRRELLVWTDCVKLRYGKSKDDSPFLWDYMASYSKLLAKYFSGIRLDNAHSTPLHVGEYMLNAARDERPNLYVVAELFSGSQEIDKLYVERLGVTSLLREAIGPGNSTDLSTVIQVNGGQPIGSYIQDSLLSDGSVSSVHPQPIHSWLMEATHDNELPAQKRTVEDTLSTAALVAFCQVSSGSTMGTDELYPVGLDVVSEERPYVFGNGISEIKATLNALHKQMGRDNYFESFTHHEGQYITVHRLNPETGHGYFVVARTAFPGDNGDQTLSEVVLEKSKATWKHGWKILRAQEETPDAKDKIVPIKATTEDLQAWSITDNDGTSTIHPAGGSEFPPGSVAIFKTERTFDAEKIEAAVRSGQREAVEPLNLLDLNILLYRANNEERASTQGSLGVYDIPDSGPLVYAGLQGWQSVLKWVVANNDLGAPIAQNLRNGLWALDAILSRTEYYSSNGSSNLGTTIAWLKERADLIRQVPSFLRPRYFAAVVQGLYEAAVIRAGAQMTDAVTSTVFSRELALTSLQMIGNIQGASLLPFDQVPSMAAGLPHFCDGIMRCWGRDVFLSVGGLMLETGRVDEAKQHILGFAKTLKYGLIPNLLDSGRNPRYNARDAVWFFVQSVQDYCKLVGNADILDDKVKRRFPLDDKFVEFDSPEAFSYESSIGEIVTEILARHAKSIKFREHNAGPQIDSQMTDEGFNQYIYVDWTTGFIHGGNQANCGTWMDKMGESTRAKNKGVPGTPRDGAAVEITGLLKSCLRWVNETRASNAYGFPSSVENQDGDQVELEKWEKLLQENFERYYYVPKSPEEDGNYKVDPKIINRRGIYKDLVGSGKPYEDYEFRPNFSIAMVTAPELFNVEHAVGCLTLADKVLRGPVGMATLDPSDYNYRPYYENSIDNDDFATSKGRNYHQGPEWVWCEGVFLQALVVFDGLRGAPKSETTATIRNRIQGDVAWIRDSAWAGLTELTQKNGDFCADSSPTQCWSTARLLEVYAALEAAK